MQSKRFEIFSGTGGVGKTTLATARAIDLAKNGKQVLLITIDPAKRLKELMGLKEEDSGEVIRVADPLKQNEDLPLFVELMNPQKTFERIATQNNCTEILSNRILSILTKPFGGLNEILAIVELDMQIKSGKFDTIVLDTPPGSHFLDFLESVDRIKLFFDSSFIDIFNYLGKKVSTTRLSTGKKLVNLVVSTGVKKLLGYLDKVTGDKFVNDFIEAIIAIYKTKGSFLSALNLQDELKSSQASNWYLVTSVEQNKLDEALELQNHASDLITEQSTIVLNKCIQETLTEWSPKELTPEFELKKSLIEREKNITTKLKDSFENILEFPEIIQLDPLDHVKQLTKHWSSLQKLQH